MVKKSTKVNHKQLNDDAYSNKYNEKVSYITTTVKYEHEKDDICLYVGGVHTKNTRCLITKQVFHKGKIYYSVVFEGTDREVNWIMEKVLIPINKRNEEIQFE